ncbi:MAG: 23S rRNA (adenine(2030)-N(6))-methyltransferase RlmJ [Phenylobacterium zucineum]|nr:MAG: 23S rRNA (adenine(2030)-N(6))-methyltransferase RlmJ [Phenylobacterium zucineum]
MNYRHAFHAGNFADLIKHAALLLVLDAMTSDAKALRVMDTHAGRGLYDVGGADAIRSGEAKAGIGRLAEVGAVPDPIAALRAEITKLNPHDGIRVYPGSPVLIAGRLRPGDSYLACELRPEEHQALAETLRGLTGVKTVCADGFVRAADLPSVLGKTLFLIDPPFERADDYIRITETVMAGRRRMSDAGFLIWLPLKDLETLDSFVRSLEEGSGGSILVAEARMRPLTDPLKMNGCVLVLVNLSPAVEAPLREVLKWVVDTLGENGEARLWHP